MRLGFVALGLVTALGPGCAPSSDSVDRQAAERIGAPTRTELARAVYSGIGNERSVQLRRGKWIGQTLSENALAPTLKLDEFFYFTGDLDWDGTDEAVVHLEYARGDDSVTDYVAVMDREGDAVVQKTVTVLGDRVQIREARLEGTRIVVDLVQPIEADPSSAGRLVTRTFTLRGGELIETGARITGIASLETLEGVEWVLTSAGHFNPDYGPLTLEFESGTVVGSLGCNTFEGTVESGPEPTTLRMSAAVSDDRPCPSSLVELGDKYLHALANAERWEWHPGRLRLLPSPDAAAIALLFERR